MTIISNFMQTLETRELPAFQLSDIPGFPSDEFNRQFSIYEENERWVTGTVLEEEISVDGKEVERYPVKINPIQSVIAKHTYALFGESNQEDRPLVYPRVLSKNKADKEIARTMEDLLYRVWWESNGRSIQFENGLISQIYGGCIFRVAYDPDDKLRSIPIRVDQIHPKYFVGKPSATDMWRLHEAWIITPIDASTARDLYNVETGSNETCWMVEHYTEKKYEITVNGVRASIRLSNGDWLKTGPNPYGFVPVVYIPHVRFGSSFYGVNAFDVVKGLILELNRRVADYGDAVSVDSHSYVGMRNVRNTPTVRQIAANLYAVDLGTTTSITGNEDQPDIFGIQRPSASDPMAKLIAVLNSEIRKYSYIPAVADGEDEGSQRSALTLAMRMWPLTSHTNMERISWTSGLDMINRMILRIATIKNVSLENFNDVGFRIKENWFPVLPRDREMTVNEVVSRMGSKLGSPEHLIEMLGDVDDVQEEIDRIVSFWKLISKVTAPVTPFGGNPADKKKTEKGKSASASTQTVKSSE